MLEFVRPSLFWLLLILPAYWYYELWFKKSREVRIDYNRFDVLNDIVKRSSLMRFVPVVIRSLIFISIIVALTQPRLKNQKELIRGEGIDIILTIDVSGSMQALDFKPVNRLEAAKRVALDFVERRKNDRFGIVVFAPHAFTICPLTNDFNLLKHSIENIDFPEDDSGTAIGMGVATAVARLKDSTAKTKLIILITDGDNNAGEIDPITAAHLAETYGIKIYAIGIGSDGLVDFPFQHPYYGTQYRKVHIDFDMETLHKISRITGVDKAWNATNTKEFEHIIKEIDSMETSEYEIEHYFRYTEVFHYFLLLALFLLFIEFLYRTLLGVEFI
ncbi:MAG: VWA domain-containing protein [Candidatus Cloacimonas sp.]|nr:VWA domain-containing protein [Candidatus Cloacimonadota bacterium]